MSRFCEYPPEAREKTNVGGFLDPNLEILIGLKPDLVILLDSAAPLRDGIEKLDIPRLTVKNQTVDDVLDSVRLIGRRCGVEDETERLIDQLNERIAAVESTQKKAQEFRWSHVEVKRLCDALSEVVDPACLGDWLTTPNDAFGGFKPLEVIERGEIDRLWEMFYRLRSGMPG